MKKKVILPSDLDVLAQAKLATQVVADKYIELYDLAQSGFFTLSEDGEIIELNLYGSQLLGKERQDLKSSLFGFFVSDITKPIFNRFLRKVFTSGTKQSCEVTLSINGIAPVYVHLIGNAIENGKQCIVNVADITEQKKAEEALKENNQFLQTLLEAIPAPVFYKDGDGHYIGVNKSFEKFFGQTSKELIGKSVFDIASAELAEIYHKQDMEILQYPGVQIYDSQVKDSNGVLHDVVFHKAPFMDSNGQIQGLIGVILDYSDRKKAEKALFESEAKFKSIYEGSNDAIMLLNEKGFLDCNTKTLELFGLKSKEDFIDIYPSELSPLIQPDGRNSFESANEKIDTAYQQGISRFEWVHRRFNGEIFPAEVILSDFNLGGERIIQATVRDITERKLAEEALKESEALYRNLVLKMPDGVYKSTHDGKFIDVNPALIKMLGYDSKEELMAIDIKAQLYFESSDRESLVLQEKLEEMGIYRLKKKDGSEIWVEDHGWYNLDEKGNILSHEGIMRDVTDRKHAEDLLQLSEERYRTIIDNIGEGIGFVNAEERFEFANMAAEKIFGVEPGGLVGMNLDQFVSPEQYYFLQKETELRSQGKKSVYELEIIRPNGEKRTILVAAVAKIDKDSGFIGTYGLFRDITDRKLAEEELAHQQYLMQTLMDNLPDHIYFKDLESRFVRISKSHALLFGLDDPDLAIGKSDCDFFTGEHSQQAYEDEQTIIRTGQPLSIVEKETFHDQPDRWVSTIKMPFLDKDEKIIGTFGISRDVTAHKFAEEVIKLKNEELQKANAEKDKFFSIIAHDLRSPFNSFLGYTELMVDELDNMSLKEIQFMAGELKKSANNLYNLLENLLEWSRIERGITGFEPKTFLLMLKITESIQSVLESSNKKGIEISFNIPEVMKVFADENMLKSTIRNLTTNAVKFTPKGGKIALSARSLDDNFVEISIKDNGIGMKKDRLDKLFKLTEQTNRPGTEGEPSSGLGLILCKDFVEKHGGKIWVESEEGKGSEFLFTIPMKVN